MNTGQIFLSSSENVVLVNGAQTSPLVCEARWQKATEAELASEALKQSSLVRLVLNSSLKLEEAHVSYCTNSGWQNLQDTLHTQEK